jgi:hypothetical protein
VRNEHGISARAHLPQPPRLERQGRIRGAAAAPLSESLTPELCRGREPQTTLGARLWAAKVLQERDECGESQLPRRRLKKPSRTDQGRDLYARIQREQGPPSLNARKRGCKLRRGHEITKACGFCPL